MLKFLFFSAIRKSKRSPFVSDVFDVGYVISDGRGGVHDGGGKRVGVWGGEDDPFARGGRGGDVETRV